MNKTIYNNHLLRVVTLSVCLPLFIIAVGDHPQRTLLKESLSLTTLVAFSLMIMLLYLNRTYLTVAESIPIRKILHWHKFIGYASISVLFFHPFMLVIPRYFESGIAPIEAFITIITTLKSSGIILGIMSWVTILLLGITSFFRNKLPMSYRNWRTLHSTLAITAVICAGIHVIDLGRHADYLISASIIFISTGGILLLIKYYLSE